MKTKKILLTTLLILSSLNASASDIRDIVKNSDELEKSPNYIDPDSHVFGVEFNSTEDEVIENLGSPDGYIRLDSNLSGMIYGSNKMYIFRNEKLYAFRLTHNVLDWKVSKFVAEKHNKNYSYMSQPWKVKSGIERNMKLTQVKEILGDRLIEGESKYHASYETTVSVVDLSFSRSQDGEGDEAYSVGSLFIRLKD